MLLWHCFPGVLSRMGSARAGGWELSADWEGPLIMAHPFCYWATSSILLRHTPPHAQ